MSDTRLEIYRVSREYYLQMAHLSYADIQALHFPIHLSHYSLIYSGSAAHDGETPEEVLFRFSDEECPPADCHVRNIRTSDVVAFLPENGQPEAFFFDDTGFHPVSGFFAAVAQSNLSVGTAGLVAEGYRGTWLSVDRHDAYGKPFFLLKHEQDHEMPFVIIDSARLPIAARKDLDFSAYETINSLRQYALEVPVSPDNTITEREMFHYGYSWPGMLPLRRKAALACPIRMYCLYEDGTESQVLSREEIEEHARRCGIFGVYKGDWLGFIRDHHIQSDLNALATKGSKGGATPC